MMYNIGRTIPPELFEKVKACSSKIISLGSDGFIEASSALTAAEVQKIKDVIAQLDSLDSFDAANIRNLTLAQVQAAVDGITDLASAKAVIKKMAIVEWWLLQREMGKL